MGDLIICDCVTICVTITFIFVLRYRWTEQRLGKTVETLETQLIILIYGFEWPFTSRSRGGLVYFPFYFDCPKDNGSWEASCSKTCR